MTALDHDVIAQGPENQAHYQHVIAQPSAAPDHAIPVQLASYPPLAQVTQLSSQELVFTAVLQVQRSQLHEPWEVSIWSQTGKHGTWQEIPMRPALSNASRSAPNFLQDNSARPVIHLSFFHTLKVDKTFSFTLKYRPGPNQPWLWVQQETGMTDGTVIVADTNAPDPPSNIHEIITGLNPALSIKSCTSQSPGANVWRLELDIDAEKSAESVFVETSIGVPWEKYVRSFGLARAWEPWLYPVHGRETLSTDKPIILASFLNTQGISLVLLADHIVLFCRKTENAIAAAIYEARSLVQGFNNTHIEAKQADISDSPSTDDVDATWRETWYDGLGYCTWNSLGQQLTAQKLYHALDQLAENKINVSSLIIDDNWQSISSKGDDQSKSSMTRFEALASAFPDGLKETIAAIKSKHPNIKHVAVWHTLFGYWGGVSPDSEISERYQVVEASRRNDMGGPMHVISANDVARFYCDFYSFLSSCGIDGVKTDAQYTLDIFNTSQDRRSLGKAYQDAWSLACLRWFSNKAISCMSQTPQIIFHSQLLRNKPPVVVRNSDDFFPRVPASHPWHVWTNAYNSLMTHYLNVVPDWDMFQTDHEYAGFHAAARCVSGGPIYITDTPGQHNLNLIKQITGETIRGRTVVFRPNTVARAADPYVGYHDNVLLKVISYHVHLTAFPGILKSSPHKYIVRAHTTGRISDIMNASSSASLLVVSLDARGYEIFTAYQISSFENKEGSRADIASLGLLGKMTGAAAILSTMVTKLETGRVHVETFIKALGVLGVYISNLPKMSIDKHFLVTIMAQVVPPHTVTVSTVNPQVLEIDIETAWKEMGLRSGWSNEVQVQIYFDIV
ncbi:putative galactinol--sucrose galactosyltransferase 1 [Ceratocystis lukuohia]|uniref:Galactinol--sucrose galactosyltransferase 1 n=1 Tax=Ceratocystis lukuohia TaxID=2019550 RepID=A0ABR4MT63_9PEZI